MPHISHHVFREPLRDTVIWRYVTLEQLLSCLRRKALYFTRSDRFEDPWEGSTPLLNFKMRQEAYPERFKDGKDIHSKAAEVERMHTFVNCWHMGPHESQAMWKLYSKTHSGIAIKSTFDRLSRSLASAPEHVQIGEVNYIDFQTNYVEDLDRNGFTRIMLKDLSLQHERELRAVTDDFQVIAEGLELPVDTGILFEEIYTFPQAPDWIHSLVVDVVGQFGPGIPVNRSRLSGAPVY